VALAVALVMARIGRAAALPGIGHAVAAVAARSCWRCRRRRRRAKSTSGQEGLPLPRRRTPRRRSGCACRILTYCKSPSVR
jgi:hypothetical protein